MVISVLRADLAADAAEAAARSLFCCSTRDTAWRPISSRLGCTFCAKITRALSIC